MVRVGSVLHFGWLGMPWSRPGQSRTIVRLAKLTSIVSQIVNRIDLETNLVEDDRVKIGLILNRFGPFEANHNDLGLKA